MSTDAEKLAQITALCDDAGYAGMPSDLVAQVRAILAEPGPAEGDSVPALVLNRPAAWRVISDAIERDRKRQPVMGSAVLDDLEDCVAIDPRLREGVTLTTEEASLAAHFVRDHIGTGWADPIWPTDDHLRALAARLEASS